MTQNEINNLKRREYNRTKGWKVYGEGGCRDMIMSCLTYGVSKEKFMEEYAPNYLKQKEYCVDSQTGKMKTHIEGFANTLDEIGSIWEDQSNYFRDHCRVNSNVYVDSEGLSYNSLVEF
jgi:hypothetical protein